MNNIRSFAIVFLISMLSISICKAEDSLTVTRQQEAEVLISEGFKKCNTNTDCVLVHTGCDHCCQTQAINKSLVKEFEENFLVACQGYSGGVCDCIVLPAEAICESNQCERRSKVKIQ